ncbi:MAG: anion permease [Propionibacteriaceae bacterium]|jgi:DASS family divalent anion:Na+ symporter|nr:anion permease [Propionibacteriaceae bacterium]
MKNLSQAQKKWLSLALLVAVGAGIWFIPAPDGFSVQAWHLFAIFVSTALGFMLRPLPSGGITVLAIAVALLTGTLKLGQAFTGLTSDVIWLIVSAFLFSRGLIKTGLGVRIAYLLMGKFGSSSLKLGYAFSLGDLIISTFVPSNTARSGGIVYPVVRSVSEVAGSTPEDNPRKLGAYLVMTTVHNDNMASLFTLTGAAGNLLVVSFAAQIAGVQLSWASWLLYMSVPVLIMFILTPLLMYRFYPPGVKDTSSSQLAAREKLRQLGPISRQEKMLSAIFLVAVLGWATTSLTGIKAATFALLGLALMLLFDIVSWDEVISEKSAWDVMFWMGGMYSIADNLAKMDFFTVFSSKVQASLAHVSWPVGIAVLVFVFLITTYVFASGISHILALYTVFLALAVALGVPPYLAVLALAVCTCIDQTMTHYSSGPAAVYFGSGYVKQNHWWVIGAVMVAINTVVFGTVGLGWWKLLGLW